MDMTFISRQFDAPRLNNIFDSITREAGLVFWMRTLDFQKQLYISPNYENLWGVSCDTLYQHPKSWMETLIEEDRDKFQNPEKRSDIILKSRDTDEDTVLFRVNKKNTGNSLLYIRDKAFIINNNKKQPIAVGGVGIPLEETYWTDQVKGKSNSSPVEKGFFLLINEILTLSSLSLNAFSTSKVNPIKEHKHIVTFKNCTYELRTREAQCLFYSANGYSAKEVAHLLKLSPRTIETHLENIKTKLNCRNKLELIGNIDISLLSPISLQLITP